MVTPRPLADWPEIAPLGLGPRARQIDSWATPLTAAAAEGRRVGGARLVQTHYRGLYAADQVGDLDYYYAPHWLPVSDLQRRSGLRGGWRTWMVDDPKHWYGMKERADALPGGRILCAGLGLGLMLWHLTARADVSQIDVCEIDPDVIALMKPLIPDDSRIVLINEDYYRHIEWLNLHGQRPDAVLWDLAVGEPEETRDDLTRGYVMTKALLGPDVPLARFGLRRVAPE
jgi:hypothetical protein